MREYVQASLAENTRGAYRSDLAHFEAWGGQIPAADTMIASYLAAHAGRLTAARPILFAFMTKMQKE